MKPPIGLRITGVGVAPGGRGGLGRLATPAASADEAAIRDAVTHWSVPSVAGDAADLNRLLADAYVSVGETGVDHPKPAIVAAP